MKSLTKTVFDHKDLSITRNKSITSPYWWLQGKRTSGKTLVIGYIRQRNSAFELVLGESVLVKEDGNCYFSTFEEAADFFYTHVLAIRQFEEEGKRSMPLKDSLLNGWASFYID